MVYASIFADVYGTPHLSVVQFSRQSARDRLAPGQQEYNQDDPGNLHCVW